MDTSAATFPSKVDLSATDYFPSIQNQGSLNSCTAFATTYYQFTYEVNRMNRTKADQADRYYSPLFIYNYANGGVDKGSLLNTSYALLKERGALKWSQFPYVMDCKKWSLDEQAMIDALSVRLTDWIRWELDTNIYSVTSIKSSYLNNIKKALCNGKLLVVGLQTDGRMSNLTIGSATNGEKIIYRCANLEGGHALTVVGYDDNVCIDVNQDGKIEPAERGAFKLANSWGTDWGNKGYIWVLYDALNQSSQISGQWESRQGITTTRRAIFDREGKGALNGFYQMEVDKKQVDVVSKIGANVTYSKNFHVLLDKSKYGYYYKRQDMTAICKGNDAVSRKVVMVYDFTDYNTDWPELLGKTTWTTGVSSKAVNFIEPVYTGFNYSLVDNRNQTIAQYEPANQFINVAEKRMDIQTMMELGDVDYNCNVELADVQLVQSFALRTKVPSNLQAYLADYNLDGTIDLKDVQAVQRKALRIE